MFASSNIFGFAKYLYRLCLLCHNQTFANVVVRQERDRTKLTATNSSPSEVYRLHPSYRKRIRSQVRTFAPMVYGHLSTLLISLSHDILCFIIQFNFLFHFTMKRSSCFVALLIHATMRIAEHQRKTMRSTFEEVKLGF